MPDDWIESHVYTPHPLYGVVVMAMVDIVLFGIVPGGVIFVVQMLWIPFWAAGVVNGLAHYGGYRNFPVENESSNIFPWGILIGGEELHNNHHAYASSAKLSSQYRFGPPFYLVALGVSFVSESASIGLCLFVAVFFAIRGWPIRR